LFRKNICKTKKTSICSGSVDGKNISGTQLRAVMGDPQITDRAKQEIFTKVYGKFDQKIFDKIVKTTTDAEEARKLTAQHGSTGKKTKKQPDDRAIKRAKSVLTKKVKNPETKRDILVATALKYPKDHPARKAAEALVQAAMQQKESMLMENKQSSDDLKVYVYVRDYTEDELKHEIDEYFKNERTLKAFPNLADSSYEYVDSHFAC
jgi:F0F1-type ATP synthase delta subunit